MAILLIVVSVIPLGISAFLEIHDARDRELTNTTDLLVARVDKLVGDLDGFHRNYQLTVYKLSRLPIVLKVCQANAREIRSLTPALQSFLNVLPSSDANVRGVAILDLTGKVKSSTEDQLIGRDLSGLTSVHHALENDSTIPHLFVAGSEVNSLPTIAYIKQVIGPKGKIGLAILWIRASALWDMMKASNELAGRGSFAVLYDPTGIRIAHSHSQDIVFHPAGSLDSKAIEALSKEKRFGEQTRTLLEDVRHFPEQFSRARGVTLDPDGFRGLSPVNQAWNYGVGRRLQTAPWTLFYMIPEESLQAPIVLLTQEKIGFTIAIMFIALMGGALFTKVLLKPIQSLSLATNALAKGDLGARVEIKYLDEIGKLSTSFNSMAIKIEAQAFALTKSRNELEAFNYSVSHDLRAPLRAIDGFSKILFEQANDLSEDSKEFLERIRFNTQKMGQLIDDLLAFSRLGRHSMTIQKIDMSVLVQQVLREFQEEISKNRIEIHLQELPTAQGDVALLKQVWLNLLSNAFKYSRTKKQAVIHIGSKASEDQNKIIYFVNDNGVGFDMRYADKLFGVFQRLHRAEDFEGTGVGLAIVKRVVERHDGKIWAESKVNDGATFFFSLHKDISS